MTKISVAQARQIVVERQELGLDEAANYLLDQIPAGAHFNKKIEVDLEIVASEEPEEGNVVTIDGGIRTEGPAVEAPKTCLCGCGQEVKNEFKPGHDQRYKTSLMRDYLAGDEVAHGILIHRGWMKFFPAFAVNEIKRQERAGLARCQVCNQPLTDPESVARGVGPICNGRHAEEGKVA